ncbi:MAG: hypothetical protein ACRDZW_11660 [Acidimicrobiales bacterium]
MALDQRRLRYFLIPHPDDEFSAWSLVNEASQHYPVFVLLTKGEATAFADGRGLQAALGERVPRPQPFMTAGTATVKAQRLDSWHAFLDAMATVDRRLGIAVGVTSPSPHFELFVGPGSARVVFDLGDGRLTPAMVTTALARVRAIRRTHLPVSVEDDAVAAGYWNRDYPGSTVYEHRDHRAVHQALWSTDHGLPGPQWGRTARSDPDAVRAGRTAVMDAAVYDAAMAVSPPPPDPAVNPAARRIGSLQRCYGWLREDYWPGGELDDTGVFSRSQTFWSRFAPNLRRRPTAPVR